MVSAVPSIVHRHSERSKAPKPFCESTGIVINQLLPLLTRVARLKRAVAGATSRSLISFSQTASARNSSIVSPFGRVTTFELELREELPVLSLLGPPPKQA